MLYSLAKDKDDDDQPKWITGSTSLRKGKREMQYRTAPPQSIRIGGKWYSYSRIEPMATSMALILDTINGDGTSMSERTWKTVTGLVRDKTFMRGLADVIAWMESGNLYKIDAWSSNFAASYMPNIVRTALRSGDPYVRQYMVEDPDNHWSDWAKRTMEKALPSPAFAPQPKVDLWGNDVAKTPPTSHPVSDFLYRLTVPVNVQEAVTPVNVDRLIMNWNAQNPSEQWYPTLPSATYKKDGKKIRMSEQEYHDFLKVRGQYALRLLGNRRFNFSNPTERDKKAIGNAFSRSTSLARRTLARKQIRKPATQRKIFE